MADLIARMDEAFRLEKAGVLDRAMTLYREVEGQAPDPGLKARSLLRQAHVYRTWGKATDSLEAAESGRRLAQASGDPLLEAELLNAQGAVYQGRGEFERSTRLFRRMLDLTDHPRIRGIALQNLGADAALQRRFGEAEAAFRESSSCFERAGYARGAAFALNNQGRVLLEQGEHHRARMVLERAVANAGRVEDLDLQALATLNLAEVLAHLDDLDAAEDCVSQALGYFTASENPFRVAECLRLQGDLCLRRASPDTALRCFKKALATAEALEARVEIGLLRRRIEGLERGRATGTP